jgi:ferredoxin-NADP reductase
VLLSGGVGATPVLAMLHALVAEKSSRPVWWLHGARNREDHPFREESRALLQRLKYGHSYIQYSRPGPADQRGVDFDAAGHLAVSAFEKIGVPYEGQFYLCGPPAFLQGLTAWSKRRIAGSRSAVWRFFARRNISFKKTLYAAEQKRADVARCRSRKFHPTGFAR